MQLFTSSIFLEFVVIYVHDIDSVLFSIVESFSVFQF